MFYVYSNCNINIISHINQGKFRTNNQHLSLSDIKVVAHLIGLSVWWTPVKVAIGKVVHDFFMSSTQRRSSVFSNTFQNYSNCRPWLWTFDSDCYRLNILSIIHYMSGSNQATRLLNRKQRSGVKIGKQTVRFVGLWKLVNAYPITLKFTPSVNTKESVRQIASCNPVLTYQTRHLIFWYSYKHW